MIVGPSAGRFYLRGASDNTLIGNVQDALKLSLQGSDGLYRANIDSLGRVRTKNTLYTQPIQAVISVSSATPSIAKVGATNRANRSSITIRNTSGNKVIYYGFIAGITAANSLIIPAASTVTLNFGDSVNVYILAETNNTDIVVVET